MTRVECDVDTLPLGPALHSGLPDDQFAIAPNNVDLGKIPQKDRSPDLGRPAISLIAARFFRQLDVDRPDGHADVLRWRAAVSGGIDDPSLAGIDCDRI